MAPAVSYEIRVEGQVSDRWLDWFGGLEIRAEGFGETTICGPFADQAALIGLLDRLLAHNIPLISVYRVDRIQR